MDDIKKLKKEIDLSKARQVADRNKFAARLREFEFRLVDAGGFYRLDLPLPNEDPAMTKVELHIAIDYCYFQPGNTKLNQFFVEVYLYPKEGESLHCHRPATPEEVALALGMCLEKTLQEVLQAAKPDSDYVNIFPTDAEMAEIRHQVVEAVAVAKPRSLAVVAKVLKIAQ